MSVNSLLAGAPKLAPDNGQWPPEAAHRLERAIAQSAGLEADVAH